MSASSSSTTTIEGIPGRLRCSFQHPSKRELSQNSCLWFRPNQGKKSSFLLDLKTHDNAESGSSYHVIPEKPCHCYVECVMNNSNNNDSTSNAGNQKDFFFLGGFQLISTARSVEVYVTRKGSNDEELLMTCRGIPIREKAANLSDCFKVFSVVPGGARPITLLRLCLNSELTTDGQEESTASTKLVSIQLTGRIPDPQQQQQQETPKQSQITPSSAQQMMQMMNGASPLSMFSGATPLASGDSRRNNPFFSPQSSSEKIPPSPNTTSTSNSSSIYNHQKPPPTPLSSLMGLHGQHYHHHQQQQQHYNPGPSSTSSGTANVSTPSASASNNNVAEAVIAGVSFLVRTEGQATVQLLQNEMERHANQVQHQLKSMEQRMQQQQSVLESLVNQQQIMMQKQYDMMLLLQQQQKQQQQMQWLLISSTNQQKDLQQQQLPDQQDYHHQQQCQRKPSVILCEDPEHDTPTSPLDLTDMYPHTTSGFPTESMYDPTCRVKLADDAETNVSSDDYESPVKQQTSSKMGIYCRRRAPENPPRLGLIAEEQEKYQNNYNNNDDDERIARSGKRAEIDVTKIRDSANAETNEDHELKDESDCAGNATIEDQNQGSESTDEANRQHAYGNNDPNEGKMCRIACEENGFETSITGRTKCEQEEDAADVKTEYIGDCAADNIMQKQLAFETCKEGIFPPGDRLRDQYPWKAHKNVPSISRDSSMLDHWAIHVGNGTVSTGLSSLPPGESMTIPSINQAESIEVLAVFPDSPNNGQLPNDFTSPLSAATTIDSEPTSGESPTLHLSSSTPQNRGAYDNIEIPSSGGYATSYEEEEEDGPASLTLMGSENINPTLCPRQKNEGRFEDMDRHHQQSSNDVCPYFILQYIENRLGPRSLSYSAIQTVKSAQQQVWVIANLRPSLPQLSPEWKSALQMGKNRVVVRRWKASSCWWNLNRNSRDQNGVETLARSEITGYRIARKALPNIHIPHVLYFSLDDENSVDEDGPHVDKPFAILSFVGSNSTIFDSNTQPDETWMKMMVKSRFEFGFEEPHPRWGRVPVEKCLNYTMSILRSVIIPLHCYFLRDQWDEDISQISLGLRSPQSVGQLTTHDYAYATMVDIYEAAHQEMKQTKDIQDQKLKKAIDLLEKAIAKLKWEEPYVRPPIKPSVLCHMDCQPQNLLFARPSIDDNISSTEPLPVVSSVLDWEEAALADPRFEILLLCRKVCANRDQAEQVWHAYGVECSQPDLGPLQPWLALETVHSITSFLLQSMDLLGGGRNPWETKPDLWGKIQREIRRLVHQYGWEFCDIPEFR